MTRLATDGGSAESQSPHVRIGVLGCAGRVGALIVQELQARHCGPGVSLAGGTVRKGLPAPPGFFTTDDPAALFECADVLIDFTRPDATARHLWLAASHRKPIVVGTTGLGEQGEREIADAAKETAILYAANMSVGVNLLLALVEQAAARLGIEWDIEIAETHHRRKIDSPSGTALALAGAAQRGRGGADNAPLLPPGREGERPQGAIGFAVRRGGDIVGDHTVSFMTEGETVEIGHRATNRALFAKGAIRAAVWLKDKPRGLYTMRDALNL